MFMFLSRLTSRPNPLIALKIIYALCKWSKKILSYKVNGNTCLDAIDHIWEKCRDIFSHGHVGNDLKAVTNNKFHVNTG